MDDLTSSWCTSDLIVVDVEGNGQSPPEIVELAAVRIVPDKKDLTVATWLVRPEKPITWQAKRIHGISNSEVEGQPLFRDVAEEIMQVFGMSWLVGHNVGVEYNILKRQLPMWKPKGLIDTLRLARRELPARKSYGLEVLR